MKPTIIDRTNTFKPSPELAPGDLVYFWNNDPSEWVMGRFDGYSLRGSTFSAQCKGISQVFENFDRHCPTQPREGEPIRFLYSLGINPTPVVALQDALKQPCEFAWIEVLAREWHKGLDLFAAYPLIVSRQPGGQEIEKGKEQALFFLGHLNDGWVE